MYAAGNHYEKSQYKMSASIINVLSILVELCTLVLTLLISLVYFCEITKETVRKKLDPVGLLLDGDCAL